MKCSQFLYVYSLKIVILKNILSSTVNVLFTTWLETYFITLAAVVEYLFNDISILMLYESRIVYYLVPLLNFIISCSVITYKLIELL